MMGVALPDPSAASQPAIQQTEQTAAMSEDGSTTLTPGTATGSGTATAASPSLSLSYPRASLVCRPNSHPFQDRSLSLDQSIKVGRSVARARPAAGNAIFDCKVLSRNHALLWYENGKFYLQDTKSSNGTFVNNQRLSKGSEESLPREVCSGDILQFGVDVMENSRKVTHGCIIATLKLYLPDGKEAKASPTIMSSGAGTGTIPAQDLYQLNQYIQDALAREQLLETKLAVIQRLVGQTEVASSEAWSSLIDEDRLLTRVEILESQLSAYNKGMTEDKLRDETHRLMEEKDEYQELAKTSLKKLHDEKIEALKKLKDVEKQLSSTEDEFAVLKELYDKDVEQNKKMAEELGNLATELETVKKKFPAEEEEQTEDAAKAEKEKQDDDVSPPGEREGKEDDASAAKEPVEEEPQVEVESNSSSLTEMGDKENNRPQEEKSTSEAASAASSSFEAAQLTSQLTLKGEELDEMRRQCDDLQDANSRLRDEIEKMQAAAVATAAAAAATPSSTDAKLEEKMEDIRRLEKLVETLQRELREARKVENNQSDANNVSSSSSLQLSLIGDASPADLSTSLVEAEEKITQLLKVKERYAELTQDKAQLEESLHVLEREVESLSAQSHTATACCLVPLAILVLSIMVAYLPTLASVFGTSDKVQ